VEERVEALVERELLIWARESAHLTIPEAAKKVGVKEERLRGWEAGEIRPTIKQLRKLGKVYRRPIAIFYLPEPPKDFAPLSDFRRFADTKAGILSPDLQFEVRRAQERREIALELYQDLGYEVPKPPPQVSLSDEPETLAQNIRENLKITRDRQLKFSDGREAFNWWRLAIEQSGVLVFQATDVGLSEMRGFSIGELPLPVIVVNNKDSQRGRIFTMLHEFVHIMLRNYGLCDLYEESSFPAKQKIEVFCNRVAGAALVPEEYLLLEELVLDKEPGTEWSDEEISELANKYGVSREVIARRLLICGRITAEFYRRKREQYEREYAESWRRGREWFPLPHRVAIINAGSPFIRLVFDSYYNRKITASDLSDFLNIKWKHVGKIEREFLGMR
jgi:Zn-dependent peptidase ImmA (M78 family)/DNA-binding XRE family transcriptional regulator